MRDVLYQVALVPVVIYGRDVVVEEGIRLLDTLDDVFVNIVSQVDVVLIILCLEVLICYWNVVHLFGIVIV